MIPIVFRDTLSMRGAARAAALCLALVSAGGCATADQYLPSWRSFGVYKIDINQGNYLSQDMVDKLKVGMTPAQVKQVLGTPLVTSPFRPIAGITSMNTHDRGASSSTGTSRCTLPTAR